MTKVFMMSPRGIIEETFSSLDHAQKFAETHGYFVVRAEYFISKKRREIL